ncbi:MAG: thioredoxin family protein [Candidatus Hodarchaeota archaeon]
MNLISDLQWNELISPTITSNEYLEIYGDKLNKVYESYEPLPEVLEKIGKFLKSKKEKLKILALGADWCPDCSRNIPRMIKLVKLINSKDITLKILYGIMKNALHKPGETIWHEKRSPPEATDPKFDLKAIPTFYFFNNAGKHIGVIVENPKHFSTLEEDIMEILEKNL